MKAVLARLFAAIAAVFGYRRCVRCSTFAPKAEQWTVACPAIGDGFVSGDILCADCAVGD